MAERQTLLSRGITPPTAQYNPPRVPEGAFGDYSGLNRVGGAIAGLGEDAGNAALKMQQLKKEKDRREQADVNDLIQAEINAHDSRAQIKANKSISETDGSESVKITQETYDSQRKELDTSLQAIQQKYPNGYKVTSDQINAAWSVRTLKSMEGASGVEARANVQNREITNTQNVETGINKLAGQGLIAGAPDYLNSQLERVAQDPRFSPAYQERLRDQMGKYLLEVTKGQVMEEVRMMGKMHPDTAKSIDQAVAEGYYTEFDKEQLYGIHRTAQAFNTENANEAFKVGVDSVQTGKKEASAKQSRQLVTVTSDPSKDQEFVLQKKWRQTQAARAEGAVNSLFDSGFSPFPFAPLQGKDGKMVDGPTLQSVRDMLADPTRTKDHRDYMKTILQKVGWDKPDADGKTYWTPADVDNFTADEVAAFATSAKDSYNRVIEKFQTRKGFEFLATNPNIAAAIQQAGPKPTAEDRGKIFRMMETEYGKLGVPAAMQSYFLPEDQERIRALTAGSPDDFMQGVGEIVAGYLDFGTESFDRVMLNDKQLAPVWPAARALFAQAQAARSGSKVAFENASVLATGLAQSALDPNASKLYEANPKAKQTVDDLLSVVDPVSATSSFELGMQTFDSSKYFNPKWARSFNGWIRGFGTNFHDQGLANILNVIGQNESQDAKNAWHEALVRMTVYNTYSRETSSRDLALESIRTYNTFNAVYSVARTMGDTNQGFIIRQPTATKRSGFENFVLGRTPDSAEDIQQENDDWRHLFDAIAVYGLPKADYSGAFGFMAKFDDWTGLSRAVDYLYGWPIAYRIEDYENRSLKYAGFWDTKEGTSYALPKELQIDYGQVFYKDDTGNFRQLGDLNFTRTGTESENVRFILDTMESLKLPDPATLARQIMSEYGPWVPTLSGDFRRVLAPRSGGSGTAQPGIVTNPISLYRPVKGEDGQVRFKEIVILRADGEKYIRHRRALEQARWSDPALPKFSGSK